MEGQMFKMTIELDEDYMLKLFKVHTKYGSNFSLSDLIEKCLEIGIDNELLYNPQ